MKNRPQLNFSLLVSLLVVGSLASTPASAQPRQPTANQQVTDTMVEDLKRRVREMSSTVDKGIIASRTPRASQEASAGPPHYRGKQGIPLPEAENVVLEPIPQPSQAELDAAAARVIAEDREAETRVTPPRKPGKCTGQRSSSVQRETGEPGRLFLDILYLPRDKAPNDPKDVFGPEVSIYEYDEADDVTAYSNMALQEVTCLPYRIRYLGNREYRFEGKAALQFFGEGDDRPRGREHPWIREKFPEY